MRMAVQLLHPFTQVPLDIFNVWTELLVKLAKTCTHVSVQVQCRLEELTHFPNCMVGGVLDVERHFLEPWGHLRCHIFNLCPGFFVFLDFVLHFCVRLSLHLFQQFQDDIFMWSEKLDVLIFKCFDLLFMSFGSLDELRKLVELVVGDFELAVLWEFGGDFGLEDIDSELVEVLSKGLESVSVVVEKVVAHHGTIGLSFLLHTEFVAAGWDLGAVG